MQEYMRIGFFNIKNLFNEEGRLRQIHEIEDDMTAAIGSIEVTSTVNIDANGDMQPSETHKIKILDKRGPLQDMAKMLGLFAEDNDQRNQKDAKDVSVNVTYELPDSLKKGYPGIGEDEGVL